MTKPKIYKVKVNKETFKKMIHSTNKDLTLAVDEKLNDYDYLLCSDEENHNVVFSLFKATECNKNNGLSVVVELSNKTKYPKKIEANLLYMVNYKIVLIF